MHVKSVLLPLLTLLSSISFSASKMRATVLMAENYTHVLKDTAFAEPSTPAINRADSLKANGNSFIGPGPLTFTFEAVMDQQPYYSSWEIASDTKFQDLIEQFHAPLQGDLISKISYTFVEAGTYYVRFVADFSSEPSEDGTYSYTTEIPYQIQVSESMLEIPNLITPDQLESKNSTFYVRYKSLISYEIWIYNRWGQELFHSTDPAQGWDGKFNGKTVPTGAYYYMVKAEGAEGISYNKKGSINVLKTRQHN